MVNKLKIQILTSMIFYQNTIGVITPLKIWNKSLYHGGYDISFHYSLSTLKESDLIILDSKFHRELWNTDIDKIHYDIFQLKKRSHKLIYFDTTDSTGCIQKELLDSVDTYWKMQILKNKEFYKSSHYGNRLFTDYYYKENNIVDNDVLLSKPIISNDNLDKITSAWNYGLSDYSKWSKIKNYLFKKTLINSFLGINKKIYNNSHETRNIDINGRFNTDYTRNTIKYSRLYLKNILGDRIKSNKVSKKIFYKELSNSKIVLSPFGWGEICYRDFEAFKYGAALFKPDMSHLETWPDFYEENNTYVPYDWNMQNVLQQIELLLDNKENLEKISYNGQLNYKKFIYEKNSKNLFVERFTSLINQII